MSTDIEATTGSEDEQYRELRKKIVQCFNTNRMDEADVANRSDFEENDIEWFDTKAVIDNILEMFKARDTAIEQRARLDEVKFMKNAVIIGETTPDEMVGYCDNRMEQLSQPTSESSSFSNAQKGDQSQ